MDPGAIGPCMRRRDADGLTRVLALDSEAGYGEREVAGARAREFMCACVSDTKGAVTCALAYDDPELLGAAPIHSPQTPSSNSTLESSQQIQRQPFFVWTSF